eukprot:CAMPEP_0205916402 /NCGR_PEP_ID=MMETSP1325-20131115/8477_1 /ASSEMBLY_ACC=CAM_ASM_000708 /TAXON_ID=236786 /ORGANISM="Florenciella sp., Strain RCC1007" /LENGTH=83 /DNA_ID=CAMNT_0053283673 /DNA_START=52 /DNA_END=301 /DNA_ORIENTATION=-
MTWKDLQAIDELLLAEVLNVRLALLRNVQVHAAVFDQLRHWRVIVVEDLGDHALVEQHQQRRLADPLALVVAALGALRVQRQH